MDSITTSLNDTPQRGRLVHFDRDKRDWRETTGWFMQDEHMILFRKVNGRYWRLINFAHNVQNFYPDNTNRSTRKVD